jgi:glycerophosphoryl diester phosphodiesterase
VFSQLASPIIFGHRGASAHAPENTLAAFELAIQQGADAIELDAKFTADGQVVVIHDQTVDRTTNGHGLVRNLSLAQLLKLDAGSHFDIAFSGEPIPTLDEVFEAVGTKTYINVELTNYVSPFDQLPIKVAQLVKKFGVAKRVMFSSFNPFALLRIHRYLPEIPIGLLATPGPSGAWARSGFGRIVPYQSLHPETTDISHHLIDRVHRRGKRLYVYTVNRPEDMIHLFSMDVDGIFTDDPLLARQVLTSVGH